MVQQQDEGLLMDIFATIIVTADNVNQARTLAAELPGGEGMFTSELSATGTVPATHYISSGYMPEEIVQAVAPVSAVSDLEPAEARIAAGLMMCVPPD